MQVQLQNEYAPQSALRYLPMNCCLIMAWTLTNEGHYVPAVATKIVENVKRGEVSRKLKVYNVSDFQFLGRVL